MNKDLLKISIRNQAIYIPGIQVPGHKTDLSETTVNTVMNCLKLGFSFSEQLLHALNSADPSFKLSVLEVLNDILGTDKNWTPLVKGWDIPTGENYVDHIFTLIANIFGTRKGTTLACGHIIPENTFPLERYNGCPFCGTPFEFGKIEYTDQGSKLRVLELWNDKDLENHFQTLLKSKTALDATQLESLKTLLEFLPIPEGIEIGMKETAMLVVDWYVDHDRSGEASALFKSPTDILRYLWYKHTGFLQIVMPYVIIRRMTKNYSHMSKSLDLSSEAFVRAKSELKLKFKRKECLQYAAWLNNLALETEKSCEIMHPKRGIWVRVIRALRLSEYSKRKGFEKLASLLHVFYNQDYTVFQGKVDQFRLKQDAENTFGLLKSRPGLFARSLFANMLWFGPNKTMGHFLEIVDQVPVRLLFTLTMYAKYYFAKAGSRSVKPLGGINKKVPTNKLLKLYEDNQIGKMMELVGDMCIEAIRRRFVKAGTKNKTIFMDETLNYMPLPIGDRSETIQDLPSALMGAKFPLEGKTIRLFMQWGEGMPAQHLDMDLSCWIAFDYKYEICSYSNLVATGCKHSGDIRQIPEKIGTAEYIDIDLEEMQKKQAKYITFTCNSYYGGSLSSGMVVGWMDSKFPMKVSEQTGVAYDPSCVQHQVRIGKSLDKGLVFGILDVIQEQIIWLEMAFGGQIAQNLDITGVKAMLDKLGSKLNIGQLLKLKAEAQNLTFVTNKEEADEVYDYQWAINSAAVTQLFVE
jgi:hypothetical protein